MLSINDVANLIGVSRQRVHQIIETNNLTVEKAGIKRLPPETVRRILNIKGLEFSNPQVITISCEKGGVGKTFLSTNVAIIAALRGLKVCLIDMDPESCATNTLLPEDVDRLKLETMLEVFKDDLTFGDIAIPSRYENLDLVPCKPKARKAEALTIAENPKILVQEKIKSLKESVDLIIFDLPPNFSPLTASCYLSCDLVVMPSFPNVYSLESIELTMADINELCKKYDAKKPELKILLNAFRDSERASRETRHHLESNLKEELIPFEIRKYQDVSNLINDGHSVLDIKTKATSDILKLVDYICPLKERTLQ
jgi:chromosome partitioning protein